MAYFTKTNSLRLPLLNKPVIILAKFFAIFPLDGDLRIDWIGIICTWVTLLIAFVCLYYMPDVLVIIDTEVKKIPVVSSFNYFLKLLCIGSTFVTSSVSKLNCSLLLKMNLRRYLKCVSCVDEMLDMNTSSRIVPEDARRQRNFSLLVLACVCILTFPINLMRLRLLYLVSNSWQPVLLFSCMYYENFSLSMLEAQFETLSYGLIIRAEKMNRRLKVLHSRVDSTLRIKYERLISGSHSCRTDTKMNSSFCKLYEYYNRVRVDRSNLHFFDDDDDDSNKSLVNMLTEVRKTYKHIWDGAVYLQKAYGLSLVASVCYIIILLLTDCYFGFYGVIGGNATRPPFAPYIWCLHQSLRFILLMETSQKMLKQGVKTRHLVSSLNNRHLDSESKEELTLFMNYITNTKIEFTACDFFTLNTRLITSAIAAGTTYLVILVQFHSEKNLSS